MALTDQAYTIRFPLPDLIVRGASHTLYAPVYLDGALVAPTGGGASTVSVYNASNTAVIDGATVTVTASIGQYAIAAGDLTSYALEEGWRVEWSLAIPSGPTLTPRNDAALVRNGLWPVISDVDLFRRVPALDPSGTAPITGKSNFQNELDEAWTMLQHRLIRLGNRPNLILEPSALREAHLYLTLAIIFEDMDARATDAYLGRSAMYREHYEAAFAGLSPRYDVDDDGQADARRRSAQPTVWLTGGNRHRGWW